VLLRGVKEETGSRYELPFYGLWEKFVYQAAS
jgi:hypothetical protein